MERPFVELETADAAEFIVKDVSTYLGGSSWRWCHARPELRFVLNSTEHQKLLVDFGVTEQTMTQTGPVTISFLVNGNLLGRVRCETPGDRRFEKAVPAEWLSTNEYTMVVLQPDKVYTAADDGVKLSITLHRAGFVE